MKQVCLFVLVAMTCSAQSAGAIRAHVKFLSSDLLEGRGVGTRGGDLAAEYIAAQFLIMGAKPAGDNGTYFQRVPLVGVETQPDATVTADANGQHVRFRWLDDFVGATQTQQESNTLDGDVIFMGHGITAPEFYWDDYKDVDVRGKIVVLFTNEPPSTDPNFFGGPALTYYGRWTYKYEEATRRGAQAVFILHTTPTAGYGFDVVRSSWSKEDPQVAVTSGAHQLAFAGWLTQDASEKLAHLAGKTVDELLQAADTRGFKPFPLGIRINGAAPAKVRQIESRNVAAIVEGSDPALKSEAVVYSAHWDHLGIGPAVDGDTIYHGAVDNATGCGMLLEIARAWSALPQKPRRSAIFLAVTAEEAGLRGSEFYAAHPFIPAAKTALNLNFDAFYPFGRTLDVSVTGAERTAVFPVVAAVARQMHLTIKPEPHPEQGAYFRSDHFSFAHVGIPAFSIEMGDTFADKPAGFGEKLFEEFNSRHYHQPSDKYREDWDFSGLVEMAKFGMRIGMEVANQDRLPARLGAH